MLDTLPNMVALCRFCHTWVESYRASAAEQGWLVPKRSGLAPEDTPIFRLGGWWMLGTDGWREADLDPVF